MRRRVKALHRPTRDRTEPVIQFGCLLDSLAKLVMLPSQFCVFDSFEDAVRDPGVDAVYLATPHHLHLGHTLIAAAQRKHILVEKPIAMTVPEAWKMISCARDSGVVLMVSEPVRYLSTVDKCNELIADGESAGA